MTMLQLNPERSRITDYELLPITLSRKSFVADRSGALFWPGERTLLVADLHLEKASAAAVRGRMLPPYDTRDTLVKLAGVLDRLDPRRIIALGDSLHDTSGADRIAEVDRLSLRMLQEGREWVWITGNHDPAISPELGGVAMPSLEIGGITLRHQPTENLAAHEISGHLHPAARISIHGSRIRRPCFVGNNRRLVIPAFGAFTGGLNVLDDAFSPLFDNDGFRVWMLGQEGVYPIATRLLVGD